MIRCNRQADLLVELKAAIWRKKHERRWFERVFRWQEDPSVVFSALKLRPYRPTYRKMPFKYVFLNMRRPRGGQIAHLQWTRSVIERCITRELSSFLEYALDSWYTISSV